MRRYPFVPVLWILSLGSCGPPSEPTPSPPPPAPVTAVASIEAPNRKIGEGFTRATDLFGPAMVSEGNFYSALPISPWSAYWFPFSSDGLFRATDSVLKKYDQYVLKRRGVASHAAEIEEKEFYHPEGLGWSGRCNAWAMASLMSPEPYLSEPVVLDGVSFNSTDLRALLVLSYGDMDGMELFGQRFNGDYKSTPEDIYADQFHRLIQRKLFEENKPVIMDKDSGVELWSAPIFKADIQIRQDPVDSYRVHVRTALMGLSPLDSSNQDLGPASAHVGTLQKTVVFEYTYDLVGMPQWDGRLKVVYGEWTGNSISNHPDFLWSLPEGGIHRSENSEIEISMVDEIIARAEGHPWPRTSSMTK